MKIESGTCNVCSAPCSSCMHYNRSMSVIGSKSESGFSGIICVRGEEADSSSVFNLDGMPICKSRNCDDLQHVASETSNLLSTGSSHDSYFENANSKAIFRTSTVYDASDDVDMPQVVSCEFVEEEQPFKRNPGHDQVSSHINMSAHLGHRFSSGQGEEQSGLECHGDNMLYTSEVRDANAAVCDHIVDVEKKGKECSNMRISSSFEMNNKAIPTEAKDGNQYLETGESNYILRKLKVTGDASLMDNICNSASVNTVSSVKSQFPLPECAVSPENDSQASHSQKVGLSFHKGGTKDIEEILNSQPQTEIIRCAEADNVESSFASLTAGSSTEHNSSTFPNHEASTVSLIRSGFSSENSKIDQLCQETRTTTDLEKPFDNDSKGNHVNVPLEGNGAVLDATKDQGYHVGTQATIEGENSDSDIVLDDVEVCDICGDAGREYLLAICSRCSDGAEHTYCMSEMLHKVPEGDWLCEECKIKEMKNQNVDECEAVSGRLNSTCLNEASKDVLSTLILKKLPKFDTGPTDLDTQGPSKGLQSPHFLTRRQADHPEEGKASELNGASIETASPRKKPVLSHQITLKNQGTGKVKTASMPTISEVQSVKGSEAFPHSKNYLRSSSFKGQPHHHSPRGLLSRSVSFNYLNNMPKVKTLIENVPHKQNISREFTTNDLRKERLVKSLSKTTSFKNTTSGRPNAELASKSSSFPSSLIEGLRGQKEVKERSSVERNNFSAMQNSVFRSSAAVASNYPIKMDAKSVHCDGKIRTISETDVRSFCKGFNDADDFGSNVRKKRTSYSSKSIGFSDGNSTADHLKKFKVLNKGMQNNISAIDGSISKVEIESQHSDVQSSESGRKDESVRDSLISTSSRLSALGGSQKLRCNETGHVTQHCSIDKLQKPAHKPVAEGNSSEVVKKGNKWREIVDASILRSRVLKGKKPDTCEELLAANTDTNCEAASKYTPSAFIQRNIVSVVDSRNDKDTSEDLNVDSTKKLVATNSGQPAVLPVEVSNVPKAGDSSHCPTITKLSVKPFAETLRSQAPLLANTLRASAIPNLECIWQGSFNVLGTGNFPEKFDEIQAHLSTCASHRVFEAAIKVPGSLQLEEVSHNISWPSHFHGIGPREENIGLFFFAKDVKSYERNYRKLMDRMHKNDLALRGNIDGIELLIFTSKKLPMNSQRWNMMYYLWGMFRAKRRHCLPVMGDEKKPSLSNLDMELPNQDLSIPSNTHVPNAQNLETSSKLIQLSESRSSKMMPEESINSVDLRSIASGVEDKTCRILEASLGQNSLNQVDTDPNVPQGQPSRSVGNSSGTTAEPLRVTDSLKSMLLMATSKPCSKEKIDGTFEKKFVNDCTNRKTGDSPDLAHDLGEESSVRRASSVPLGCSNCNQGNEFSTIEGKMRDKESSTFGAANVLEADFLNNESRANRKRGRSCSEMVLLRGKQSWMSIEDEREQKKSCYPSDGNVSTRLSSKVHPLYSSILSRQEQRECINSEPVMLENSITTERCFFPMDLCPVQNNKSANIIHISSSDEDTPESCSPDLELALGGKSKSTKPAALPLVFASVDGGQQHMESGSLGDDGDDVSASLSLSLGFSAPERVGSAKSILKKEHVLPERPSANTSLFLFGRFCNT